MATLIYSDKCNNCYDVVEYIKTEPSLHSVVSYHHIQEGIPEGVTKVPSLVTANGDLYVGRRKIEEFLRSLVPKPKLRGFKPSPHFKLADFGKTQKPIMTEEFRRRTEIRIEDAMANLKNS
jgi:hypothetical protein